MTARPSFAAFLAWVGPSALGGGVAVVLLIVIAALRLPGQFVALLATVVILLAALAIGISLFFRSTEVTVTATGIEVRDAVGRIRSLQLSRVGSILVIDNLVSNATKRYRRTYVLDGDGRRFLRMRGEVWPRETQDAVTAALGLTPTELTEPLTARAFARQYPGLFGWAETNPFLLGFAILAGIVAVSAIVAWLA